jgi:hypothetical protein
MTDVDLTLYCEGESDFPLLRDIFKVYAPQIRVQATGGKDDLNILCKIANSKKGGSAFFIRDRDFDYTSEKAEDSLQTRDAPTNWPRHDLECYLLYEDWLWEAVEGLLNPQNKPSSESQIRQDIQGKAQALVADHAGQQTIHILNRNIQAATRFHLQQSSSQTQQGAMASDESVWHAHIMKEVEKLKENLGDTLARLDLGAEQVESLFDQQMNHYKLWAQDMETIRLHFSGKRILQALGHEWHVKAIRDTIRKSDRFPPKKQKASWEQLRDALIKLATEYARDRHMDGFSLTTDPRLGDFGRLGAKILGRAL